MAQLYELSTAAEGDLRHIMRYTEQLWSKASTKIYQIPSHMSGQFGDRYSAL